MKKSNSKILHYLKNNAVYLILSLCIIAIGLSVTLMMVNRDSKIKDDSSLPVETPVPDDKPNEEPVIKVVTFIMPVTNPSNIGDYSEAMVFNPTLDRYSSHLAIDFFAPEGTPVCAVYEGEIESVTNTLLHGTTIVINHGDGLKTYYNSLADGDMVTVGQKVAQGDIIGEVSTTNRQEYQSGAHLHFSVEENGEVIDPIKYLPFVEK